MARPLRIQYPGALYHVMSRGNARQDVFLNNADRIAFLKNLEVCSKTHNFICHAYCLMNNHYHLLIETPDANLSDVMRDINGNYTQAFNKRNGCIGHLLQGRYKAHIIEKESYLLEVARYIVLNPVRANMVEDPSKWRWSSYKSTGGIIRSPKWLSTDWILGLFSKNRDEATKQYRSFVQAGTTKVSPFDDIKEGIILGSPQFIDWIWNNHKDAEVLQEVVTNERMIGRHSLEDLFSTVSTKEQRNWMIKMAKIRAAYSLTEIADHLGLHRTTVSKIFNKKP